MDRFRVFDRTVDDRVDDGAGIFQRDTFSGAVPTGVHQVSFCTVLVHFLYQTLRVHGGVQREERFAESGRERRLWFSNSTLGTCQLGGKSAEEVVLCLVVVQNRNGRQHAERVSRQVDDLLGMAGTRRKNDLADMMDRVRNARVLGRRDIGEVDVAFVVHCHVFQQGIATDGTPDIGFVFFREVHGLRVATAFVVEDTIVVPAMLVVTNQETLRVGRKRGLAGTGEAEEYSYITVFAHVGRAVHRCYTAQGQVVVHQRENSFLHLTAVPGTTDHLHLLGQVEQGEVLGIQPLLLPFIVSGFGTVETNEIGFTVAAQLVVRRTDEHVGHEVCLPSYLHHETNFHARIGIGTAKSVYDV